MRLRLFKKNNSKGEALTVVFIVLIMMAIISATVMSLAYNQRRLAQTFGFGSIDAYYRAKGGMVDAFWRIRNNFPVGTDYTNAATTAAYNLDVSGDGAIDTRVEIGARDAVTQLRPITSWDL